MSSSSSPFSFQHFLAHLDGAAAVIDGGLGTHIERLQKQRLEDPLWSAHMLCTENGRKTVVQAHRDYLESGADVVRGSMLYIEPRAIIDVSPR